MVLCEASRLYIALSLEFLREVLGETCLRSSLIFMPTKATSHDTTTLKEVLVEVKHCMHVKMEASVSKEGCRRSSYFSDAVIC